METTIQGIPCLIEVTYYAPPEAQTMIDPGCAAEYEYEVCDRSARPAPWLEAKMAPDDHDRIINELDNARLSHARETRAILRANRLGVDI